MIGGVILDSFIKDEEFLNCLNEIANNLDKSNKLINSDLILGFQSRKIFFFKCTNF